LSNEFFLAFLLGLCAGSLLLPWHLTTYKRILVSKTLDGTAEFINDKPYYIISNEDWSLLRAWRLPMLHRRKVTNDFTLPDAEVDWLMQNSPEALQAAADYNCVQAEEARAMDMLDCAAFHDAREKQLHEAASRVRDKYRQCGTLADAIQIARGSDAPPIQQRGFA
jgi:hypothetical protein